ncbi:MAG: UPF0175 family protein [Planctomycetia bacterium]|nr:UPF0175 family protein [Planctomycetia bacterium]
MALKSISVSLALPDSLHLTPTEAQELVVLRLLDEGRLSQSQAAKALGVTRYELLDLMARRRVPVVRYAADEWADEGRALARSGRSRGRRRAT